MNIKKYIKEKISELLNEDNKKDLRILYLHGLGSSPKKDNVELLKKHATIIAPELDLSEDQFEAVLKIANYQNIDGIVGHSVGGYLAYHISNGMELPYLIFNPAFGDKDSSVHKILNPDKISSAKPQMIVIGGKDDEVSPLSQVEYLEKHQSENIDDKTLKIHTIKDMGHDVPDEIKLKYFKMFINQIG